MFPRWLRPAPRRVGWIALAIALASSPIARANGPEVGRDAGMVFPLRSDSVQLVSERVFVRLPASFTNEGGIARGEARCRYTLRNLARTPRRFEMGFVTNPPLDPRPELFAEIYRAANFRVTRGDDDLEVRWEAVGAKRWNAAAGPPPDSIPVWTIALSPRDSAEIAMTYDVTWSGGSDGRSTGLDFTYRARPAALWAGRIERAEIVFAVENPLGVLLGCRPADACVHVTIEPKGFQWKDGRLRWSYRDWEPDTDFRVSLGWLEPDLP